MSSTAHQHMLSHDLFEEQDHIMSSQLGILNNLPFLQAPSVSLMGYDQLPWKLLNRMNETTSPSEDRHSLVIVSGDHHHHLQTGVTTDDNSQRGCCGVTDQFQQGSRVRSTTNHWAQGDLSDCINMKTRSAEGKHHVGVSTMRMKKMIKQGRRKVRDPRFCFKTMSDVDVLDDGYKWRKYGQKVVKDTLHPRSYYRCTQDNCRVKKRIERLAEDPRMVITTYEGRHMHSPSHDEGDYPQASSSSQLINNFFW